MIRNTIPQTPYCPPNRQYVLRCVRMARPLFVRAPHVSLAQGPWGHLLQVPDQGPHLDPPPPRLGPLQTSLALIPGTVTAALSMVLVRSQAHEYPHRAATEAPPKLPPEKWEIRKNGVGGMGVVGGTQGKVGEMGEQWWTARGPPASPTDGLVRQHVVVNSTPRP